MTLMWYVVTLTSLFVLSSSAGKNDIVKTVPKHWITSDKNLATLMKISFDSWTCCNVFLDGESETIDIVFNEFVKNHPNEYFLNRPSYACSDFLMISTSVDRLVSEIQRAPLNIASLKVLVIVIDGSEEPTRLLNASLYRNAEANVATLDGLWTFSKNYLAPRIFKKVSNFVGLTRGKEGIDFQGREIIATAHYQQAFCHLRTTVNRTVNGIHGEYFVAKNESELDGIDLKLFMLIAERLNFTWSIKKFTDRKIRYGLANETHYNGGMVGQVIGNKVDIAFTDLWFTVDKHRFANLTRPWGLIGVSYLVPRPKPYSSFWALTKPLSPAVWCAILSVLAVQSIFVYASARMNRRIPARFRSFVITWTEMLGRLIGTSTPKIMNGLRIQFQLWHFAGILLATAYSCNLAADLTNLCFEKRIDSPQDFIEANLTWGTEQEILYLSHVIDHYHFYGRRFADRYEQHTSQADRDEAILRGNYAILGYTIFSIFFPDEPVSNDLLHGFRLMKYNPGEFWVCFAVQPWLVEPVNEKILQMRETGIVKYHVDVVLHREAGSALREVLIERDGTDNVPRVLQLMPLGVAYLMLVVGLFISFVVFCFELRFPNKPNHRRVILMRMERSRRNWEANELRRKRSDLMVEKSMGATSICLAQAIQED